MTEVSSAAARPPITVETLRTSPLIQQFITTTNEFLGVLGRIQHDAGHAELVARLSYEILEKLGHPQRECELAAIAGYLHDLGNLVNRASHGFSGALLAYQILRDLGMEPKEYAQVMAAIGNHEENTGGNPVNSITAAVILADKSNVHRSRVRKCDLAAFTTRDRVNYAAEDSELEVRPDEKLIAIRIKIDCQICSVVDYFEIYMVKMMLCRKAAQFLGCQFELWINDSKLL
ncbi:MAG: HD domain-containing protein [Firmicutes bacterium]|nr:HD domain-containing protein [Bacillota bacterium]